MTVMKRDHVQRKRNMPIQAERLQERPERRDDEAHVTPPTSPGSAKLLLRPLEVATALGGRSTALSFRWHSARPRMCRQQGFRLP